MKDGESVRAALGGRKEVLGKGWGPGELVLLWRGWEEGRDAVEPPGVLTNASAGATPSTPVRAEPGVGERGRAFVCFHLPNDKRAAAITSHWSEMMVTR